jgi:AcrR family transcriptional regulator
MPSDAPTITAHGPYVSANELTGGRLVVKQETVSYICYDDDMATGAAGRPRDPSIDERAVSATVELLIEAGFEATTMQAIAKRSGVHASALYRRWPSRFELIERAIFPGLDPEAVQPTGDLRADISAFVDAYLATFGTPQARVALPGLVAYRHAAGPTRAAEEYLDVSARPHFVDILRAAPAGAVDPELDTDDLFDLLLGAILARVIVPPIAARERPVGVIVDLVLRAMRPVREPSQAQRRAR